MKLFSFAIPWICILRRRTKNLNYIQGKFKYDTMENSTQVKICDEMMRQRNEQPKFRDKFRKYKEHNLIEV